MRLKLPPTLSNNPQGRLTKCHTPLGSHSPSSSAKSGLVYPGIQPPPQALMESWTQPNRREGLRSLQIKCFGVLLSAMRSTQTTRCLGPRALRTHFCHTGVPPHSTPCSRGSLVTTSPQPPPTAGTPSQGGEPRSTSQSKKDNARTTAASADPCPRSSYSASPHPPCAITTGRLSSHG